MRPGPKVCQRDSLLGALSRPRCDFRLMEVREPATTCHLLLRQRGWRKNRARRVETDLVSYCIEDSAPIILFRYRLPSFTVSPPLPAR